MGKCALHLYLLTRFSNDVNRLYSLTRLYTFIYLQGSQTMAITGTLTV